MIHMYEHQLRSRVMRIARAIAIAAGLFLVSGGPVWAQPAPIDYATLAARSAALSPADKASAQALFATGFALWQLSGAPKGQGRREGFS